MDSEYSEEDAPSDRNGGATEPPPPLDVKRGRPAGKQIKNHAIEGQHKRSARPKLERQRRD